MDRSSPSSKQIDNIAGQLFAYSLYRQGRIPESMASLEKLTSVHTDPKNRIALGLLCAQMGKWDEAVSHWKHLPTENICSNGYARHVSDGYLKAAVSYSEKEKWEETFACLAQAKSLCPDNPILDHVPARIESDLPLIYHETGDYDKAINLWEDQLKKTGKNTSGTLHLMAISSLSHLYDKGDLPVDKRIEQIQRAHMYWCALAGDEKYWECRYLERKEIYGETVSLSDFKDIGPKLGIAKCGNLLDHLEEESKKEPADTHSTKFETARTAMAVEEQSATLLSKLCCEKGLDWPSGGLSMLSTLWGQDKFNMQLDRAVDQTLESSGWLLAGLTNPKTSKAFLRYMTGACLKCIELCTGSGDPNLENLAGLAVVTRAENALEAKQYQGCRELGKHLSNISNQQIKNRGKAVLEKMVPQRLKTLRSQAHEDEAILVCKDVLLAVSISAVADTLSGMLLKRSEKRYDKDDLDGFFKDYDDALRYAENRSVCEKHLVKIARYHLNKLYGDKNFSKINQFLGRLKSKYPQMAFVKAQQEFFNGLELIDRRSISDPSVINHFEKAYQADRSDTNIADIYSMALSSKAVNVINNATSGYVTPTSIQGAIRESESLLIKALEVNPQNTKAKENLLQLVELGIKANCNVSPRAFEYLGLNNILRGL